MKNVREICAAVVLLIMLSLPVMGGHIHTDAIPPPPPPPPVSATVVEPGDTATGNAEGAIESETLLTEITVSILQLLSVF
jgi:hypothetical protein